MYIRLTEAEADKKNRVSCRNESQKSCARVTHAMILKLSHLDDVKVVSKPQGAFTIDHVQICLQFSNVQLPEGVFSTSVTH